MEDRRFLEIWTPIAARLRAVEDRYRSQRLRPGVNPHPAGAALETMLEDLRRACELYIAAAPGQREAMRALPAESYVLPPYLLRLITLRPKGMPAASEHALRLALAAASLENNKTDSRDTLLALGAVYADAVNAGMDPDPFFQEAASWSSREDDFGYRIAPMRDFLSNFKESAFFKADVQARLSSGHS